MKVKITKQCFFHSKVDRKKTVFLSEKAGYHLYQAVLFLRPLIHIPNYLKVVRTHLQYGTQLWAPQHKNDKDLLQWVQRTVKMNRGMEHLSCRDRLRELELFSVEEAHCGLSDP